MNSKALEKINFGDSCLIIFARPVGESNPVTGVRGRYLDRLTNGPFQRLLVLSRFSFGAPSGLNPGHPD